MLKGLKLRAQVLNLQFCTCDVSTCMKLFLSRKSTNTQPCGFFSSPFRNLEKLSVTFNVALQLNRIPFVIYSKEKSYTKNKLIKFNEIIALLSATNSFSWCLKGIQTKTNKTKNKNTQAIMGRVHLYCFLAREYCIHMETSPVNGCKSQTIAWRFQPLSRDGSLMFYTRCDLLFDWD